MDGANYMSNNNNEKLVLKNHHHQQQQWGFVKEETFSSDQFQWPAKNYACNFCRREFKSAQALGGHMNVHRRDRARLRLLPSWVADDSYPNPNISLSPPSSFTFRSNFKNSLSSIDEEKKAAIGSSSWNKPSSGPQDHDEAVLHVLKKKKKSLVNLELKMGNLEGCSNEDLDLELHL